MTTPTMIYVERIPEFMVPGKRLGRHIRRDDRSAAFLFTGTAAPKAVTHARHIPILDQGNLGSCTGNALTGALGCDPDWDDLPAGHPVLDEKEAVHLYSVATTLDSAPGQYPPDDTGSDGISVCKAAQQAGLLSGYQHCLSVPHMAAALQAGPVIIGIAWYDSFDQPDSSGLISIAPGASIRGGHEVLVRGVDPGKQEFFADNSWGASWGDKGSFRFAYETMDRLFGEQGDCTVPVPISKPAPTPTPAPTPQPVQDPADVALASQVRAWLADKGL